MDSVEIKLPNGEKYIISPKGGLVKINILDYIPELEKYFKKIVEVLPGLLEKGVSPKADFNFGKLNHGLYRYGFGNDNLYEYILNLNEKIEKIPGYKEADELIVKFLSDILQTTIEFPQFIDGEKKVAIPHWVWRDLSGGDKDKPIIAYHTDDILNNISLYATEVYNYFPFLKQLRNGERNPYMDVLKSKINEKIVDGLLTQQKIISKSFTQIATNIFLSVPEEGGETYIAYESGIVSYKPERVGDMFLFSPQAPHKIMGTGNSKTNRYTMANFIVVPNNGNISYQFG